MTSRLGSLLPGLLIVFAACGPPAKTSASGTDTADSVPSGHVRVYGEFQFPAGNPFPGGRLPELHILCANQQADGARHNPYLHRSAALAPAFSLLINKGETYSFYWVYEFGTEQRFAEWRVPQESGDEIRLVLVIDPDGHGKALTGPGKFAPSFAK